jgi:hypothetical protein
LICKTHAFFTIYKIKFVYKCDKRTAARGKTLRKRKIYGPLPVPQQAGSGILLRAKIALIVETLLPHATLVVLAVGRRAGLGTVLRSRIAQRDGIGGRSRLGGVGARFTLGRMAR